VLLVAVYVFASEAQTHVIGHDGIISVICLVMSVLAYSRIQGTKEWRRVSLLQDQLTDSKEFFVGWIFGMWTVGMIAALMAMAPLKGVLECGPFSLWECLKLRLL